MNSQTVDTSSDSAWITANSTVSITIAEDLENRYIILKQERDNLNAELEVTKAKFQDVSFKLLQQETRELEIKKYENEAQLANNKVESLNKQVNLANEKADRFEVEIDSLREENSRLSTIISNLSRQVSDFELQNTLKESEAIPLFHEKQRLETEVSALQAHSTWLENELASKSKQYQHLQRESRDRTIQLQLQLDQTINEKEALSARLDALEKIERKLQDKVNQLSVDNLNCKHELTTSRQNFEAESQEQGRVINLQKEHIARWQQRYEDIVRENENLKTTANQAIEMREKELESERNALDQKYTSLLEEQARSFEQKLKNSSIVSNHAGAGSDHLLALPASTSMTIGIDSDHNDEDEPMSMTDLYQQLAETKNALVREQTLCKCWKLQFERVQQEIQDVAPKLILQRQQYDNAMEQLSDYKNRLMLALSEREYADKEAAEARRVIISLEKRLTDRKEESQELAKQVQALLVSRCSEGLSVKGETDIPTSIQEMQSQNQRLLMEHRRLTQTVQELEEKLQADETKLKLEALTSELVVIKMERDQQESFVEQIVQQRDLYRALLDKHNKNILGSEDEEITALDMVKHQSDRVKKLEAQLIEMEANLKKAQSELQTCNLEKEEMSSRLIRYEAHSGELMKSIEKLERDLLTARSDEARMTSESEYHKGHCERLEGSLDRARTEISHLNSSKNELQRINADLQQVLFNKNSECGVLETEKQQLENKARLLQAQLETARSAEKRLGEENSQLRLEVTRQGTLIESVRRIEATLSANNEGDKETLRREKDALSQRLADESTRYRTELENLNARNQELETRVATLTVTVETLQKEAQIHTDTIVLKTEELLTLETKYATLESQLIAAKKKLGDTAENLTDDINERSKLEDLQSEVEALKLERDTLTESVKTFQKIAKENENQIAELQKLSLALKNESDEEISGLKIQLDGYRDNINAKDDIIRDLTSDLANQRDEREKAIEELKKTILSLETQIENNRKDFDSAKATAAALTHDMVTLRDELKDAQNNYEHELSLHSRARTALRATREDAELQSILAKKAEQELQNIKSMLSEMSKSWEDEKAATKDHIESLERRLKESQDQNNLLHNQLEAMSSMVEKTQSSRISSLGTSDNSEVLLSDAENNRVTSELREIVAFLRSENDLITKQLDTAKRVADRERSTAAVLRRNLEEAQSELDLLRVDGKVVVDSNQSVALLEEKFQAREEQLILLKDSNTLLREEVEKAQSKLRETLAELENAKKTAQPSADAQRRLESTIVSLEAEKDSLKRELDSWKGRVTNLVSKFHQIDPEEHKKLKSQVEELQKEKESLNAWKKTTEEESNRIRTIAKTLNQKNREQKALIDTQQKDIERLTVEKAALTSSVNVASAKEIDELKDKISKMITDAESKKRELEGANSRNDRLREKLREFQTMIRDLRAKEKTLSEQLENAKKTNSEQPVSGEIKLPTSDSTSKDQAEIPDDSIPTIPAGGFKFGPSDSSRSQGLKPTEPPKVSPPQTLRAGASAFVPTNSSSSPIPSVGDASIQAGEHKSNVVETPASTSTQTSAATKELSMKEMLMAKKQRLQEALKRKQEVERASPKPEKEDMFAEHISKRTKTDSFIKSECKGDKDAIESNNDVRNETGSTPDKTVPVEINNDGENKNSNLTNDDIVEPKEVSSNVAGTGCDENASNALISSNFPKNSSVTSTPSTSPLVFGQSSGIAQNKQSLFGQTSTSSFGGAFLDIKPPSSSSTPPTFTFGTSASITLPTPSVPVAMDPFGTFSSNSSFGGFSSTSATTIPSMPLFGSAVSADINSASNTKSETEQ